jgi:hypothetical protein
MSNRVQETRAADTRDAAIRARLSMDFFDELYIPPHKIPPDVEYAWARDSIYGYPDPARMAHLSQKGWDPVPAERHPDFATHQDERAPAHVRGFIYRRGLILIERRKEYCDLERKQQEEYNFKTMMNIPGLDQYANDSIMPMKVFAKENSIVKTSRRGAFGD